MPKHEPEKEASAYEALLAYFPEAKELQEAPAAPAGQPEDPTDPTEQTEDPADPADQPEDPTDPAAAPAESEQLSELKAQIAELQAKLAEKPAAPEPPEQLFGDDPLAHVEDETALAQEIERARRITKWATLNWDGVNPDGEPTSITNEKGEKVELTAAQIREYYAKYRDILDQAPNKAQQLRATQELVTEAHRVYPELADPKSPEAALASQLLKALPGLKRFPDWKLFVGDWVRGQKLRLEAKQAPVKPAAQAKVTPELAPKAPLSKAAKVPDVKAAAKVKAAEQVFNSAGSKDALENYFLSAL